VNVKQRVKCEGKCRGERKWRCEGKFEEWRYEWSVKCEDKYEFEGKGEGEDVKVKKSGKVSKGEGKY